jgi:protein archease
MSSELLGHTAEVGVRVRAPTLGELAAEAGRALATLQIGEAARVGRGPWREIVIDARDREALLVDWLNELIYLAETERWVATEFEVRRPADTRLVMGARGVAVERAPARVKAATFHGLTIAATPEGLTADVLFDV